jgi:CheY-like chemotaxis protein
LSHARFLLQLFVLLTCQLVCFVEYWANVASKDVNLARSPSVSIRNAKPSPHSESPASVGGGLLTGGSDSADGMLMASFNISRQNSQSLVLPQIVLNVMVVDDTAMHRKMVIRSLQAVESANSLLTLTIHEGEDGRDAIAMVVRASAAAAAASGTSATAAADGGPLRFDVIFMDFNMVHVNGDEAIKAIRQQHGFRGPIYAVTANECESEHAKLRDAGATCIFIKPLRLDQLRLLMDGESWI